MKTPIVNLSSMTPEARGKLNVNLSFSFAVSGENCDFRIAAEPRRSASNRLFGRLYVDSENSYEK
jgi:hypothetical protein